MVLGRKPSLMGHPGNADEDADADNHVDRVHSGEGEIERIENLRMLLDFRLSFPQLDWIVLNFVYPQ